MKKILSIILLLFVVLFSACGKKGPPVYQGKSGETYKQS
tara:strand:+ start:357 stop:473 length:117 start_codon:yes stop_codon:yes gene_type:complete